MDKGRPFSFLDHALKCGDSLVGADEKMYQQWAFSRKDAAFTLDLEVLNQHLETARLKRKELESFTVLDVHDAEHKAELLKEADAAMARVKLGCDLLVGVRLLGLKQAEQESMLSHLLWDYIAGQPMDTLDALRALHAARKERAFHWPFEFPEVVAAEGRGGFSAFVGNPPFIGGRRIRENLGDIYRDYLDKEHIGSSGNADICSFFFLQGFYRLQKGGNVGFIATNTISQGDTRETGLDRILNLGGIIYRATINTPWPGMAAVSINTVYIRKGLSKQVKLLDGKIVENINAYLDTQLSGEPYILFENIGCSYQGSLLQNQGFVLTPAEAQYLLNIDKKNIDVVKPYLRGEDFNTNYDQSPSYWVIDFRDMSLNKANEYSECMRIVKERVFPSRMDEENQNIYKNMWWQFWRPRVELYQKAQKYDRILFHPFTSKFLVFDFVPTDIGYTAPHILIITPQYSRFAVLQSNFHESWVRKYCSTLETRLRYAPSDVFENFSFPKILSILEKIGNDYRETRRQLMLSRQEGLTNTYNRFHNPKEKSADIAHLRELHIEMDNTVATAYGWNDLALGHGFHETPQGVRFTISEEARREVLARLLQLNHERYEEEVKAGLREKDKKKAKDEKPARLKPQKLARPEGQLNLLAESEATEETEFVESVPPTPSSEIGSWDRCKCLVCDKTVMGFSIAEHTKSEHQGKDPGYRKL